MCQATSNGHLGRQVTRPQISSYGTPHISDPKGFRQITQCTIGYAAGRRKVLVFIHGYNTMFAEGLSRFTQIVDDADAPSSPRPFHLGLARTPN